MNIDATDILNTNDDDGVTDAAYVLIEAILQGENTRAPFLLLLEAVGEKEQDIIDARTENEPSDEDPYLDRGVSRRDFS